MWYLLLGVFIGFVAGVNLVIWRAYRGDIEISTPKRNQEEA